MRIDVVSIFPDYLAALELSLPGRARRSGLVDLAVHDLRQWTHDSHRTVDDKPYGGGAGMVMKPGPWGEALDALAPAETTTDTVLVVPTPSGQPFTQAVARELSEHGHLIFACGRYEGIDQRVMEHAASRMCVRELSIGDYVLNGGEAAALAIIEAVIRLLPGFMGNAESLVEESHESGLLEYPAYTTPATWRGLEVPKVLRSGDHSRIREWRHEQSVRRTAVRRPDLVHPSTDLDAIVVRPAERGDAGELLTLQRACWVQEALANDHLGIPALRETLDDVIQWLGQWRTLVMVSAGRIVGSVRARADDGVWDIGRIAVAPDLQGRGLGRELLRLIEAQAPPEVAAYELFTGVRSDRNIRMYRRAGYRPAGEIIDETGRRAPAVRLRKRRSHG